MEFGRCVRGGADYNALSEASASDKRGMSSGRLRWDTAWVMDSRSLAQQTGRDVKRTDNVRMNSRRGEWRRRALPLFP